MTEPAHDTTIHWITWGVFAVFFALVTVLGFVAARWKRACSSPLLAKSCVSSITRERQAWQSG